MLFTAIKALISGMVVAAISEVSKRHPGAGGLLSSLPLVSILGMIWLWRDRPDGRKIAALSTSTFWYVLVSMPMFLLIPAMLDRGWTFSASMVASCALTVALYILLAWLGPRVGIAV